MRTGATIVILFVGFASATRCVVDSQCNDHEICVLDSCRDYTTAVDVSRWPQLPAACIAEVRWYFTRYYGRRVTVLESRPTEHGHMLAAALTPTDDEALEADRPPLVVIRRIDGDVRRRVDVFCQA